jgi:hypothetical protein
MLFSAYPQGNRMERSFKVQLTAKWDVLKSRNWVYIAPGYTTVAIRTELCAVTQKCGRRNLGLRFMCGRTSKIGLALIGEHKTNDGSTLPSKFYPGLRLLWCQ